MNKGVQVYHDMPKDQKYKQLTYLDTKVPILVKTTKILEDLTKNVLIIDPAGEPFMTKDTFYGAGWLSRAIYDKFKIKTHIPQETTWEKRRDTPFVKLFTQITTTKQRTSTQNRNKIKDIIHVIGPDARVLDQKTHMFKHEYFTKIFNNVAILINTNFQSDKDLILRIPLISGGSFLGTISQQTYIDIFMTGLCNSTLRNLHILEQIEIYLFSDAEKDKLTFFNTKAKC